jgi:hypothetical protein
VVVQLLVQIVESARVLIAATRKPQAFPASCFLFPVPSLSSSEDV